MTNLPKAEFIELVFQFRRKIRGEIKICYVFRFFQGIQQEIIQSTAENTTANGDGILFKESIKFFRYLMNLFVHPFLPSNCVP